MFNFNSVYNEMRAQKG
uniref:Uncharacterized protein n=1 Tax=Anguilla anguilla TaxID=7936 RepID=A0A0E9VT26_ANGAN